MDPLLQPLNALLDSLAPGMGGLAIASSPLVTAIVAAIRRFWLKNLAGNAIQTVAAVVSLVVVLLEAQAVNTFGDGLSVNEGLGLILVFVIVFLGALGFNEVLRNQNDPAIHPKPSFNAPPPSPPEPLKTEGP